MFHLQRSSGVRRWVALRKKKKTHKSAWLWSLCEEQGSTRSHTKMKFQNKRLSCDLQFSSGAAESENTSVPSAFVMPLWISCLRDKAAEQRREKDSHQNTGRIERYIPELMKLGFKLFFWFVPDSIWVNCARHNWLKNNKAERYNGNISILPLPITETNQNACKAGCNTHLNHKILFFASG